VGHILQNLGQIVMACSASSHILINDDNLAQSIDRSSAQPEALMRKRVLFSFTLSRKMKLQIYLVWPALFSS